MYPLTPSPLESDKTIFKLFLIHVLQVLVIVTFLLARIGKDFDGFNPMFGESLDGIWVGQEKSLANNHKSIRQDKTFCD